ncbi:MAG: YraN family protein [Nitrospiraceae bacterium]|nr:MAG: YraN family protein [Nitrospiraceae bacterium]
MKLGEKGDGLAAAYLRKKGYKIITQNFKTRIGEIDIIAMEEDTLVFVEVKTRESIAYGKPFEAVDYFKKRKIANTAMLYLKKLNEIPPCRFDVVSIYYDRGKPECELIRDAFEV